MTVIERWWRVKVEGYNSWTFAESEAEQARRNGYEVIGPFVLEAEQPQGAVGTARVLADYAEWVRRGRGEAPHDLATIDAAIVDARHPGGSRP